LVISLAVQTLHFRLGLRTLGGRNSPGVEISQDAPRGGARISAFRPAAVANGAGLLVLHFHGHDGWVVATAAFFGRSQI
jgi:hypothetical protein